MKKLFTIAIFFWACTFTQQAQTPNSKATSSPSQTTPHPVIGEDLNSVLSSDWLT
ncbi:hypothetical protein CLV48_101672 [Cecembia rubra]|uniref:Uncharacterized protein n=1 Tax=Cecembia rubra TaxID=1485585 RepID=A0A2P8EE79_9BACT|nr:hypothetical protein CLV48_101672 [Cecembia rubra]